MSVGGANRLPTRLLPFALVATAAFAALGCGAATPCPCGPLEQAAAPDPGVPEEFVRVIVDGVLATDQGNALLLRSDELGRVLPVFIGDAEANVIQLRLSGGHFERPLTHDLLDRVMARLGGQLVRVLVTKLRGDTFLGTVILRQGDWFYAIDARPSDAVAMAVGRDAPVFVSRHLLESTGLPLDQLQP
jgi:bifunctional DNase/RNase